MKTVRLFCELATSGRYIRLAVRIVIALLLVGASTNVNAVIRPPFPLRPSPPYRGHYIMIGNDSITA